MINALSYRVILIKKQQTNIIVRCVEQLFYLKYYFVFKYIILLNMLSESNMLYNIGLIFIQRRNIIML